MIQCIDVLHLIILYVLPVSIVGLFNSIALSLKCQVPFPMSVYINNLVQLVSFSVCTFSLEFKFARIMFVKSLEK